MLFHHVTKVERITNVVGSGVGYVSKTYQQMLRLKMFEDIISWPKILIIALTLLVIMITLNEFDFCGSGFGIGPRPKVILVSWAVYAVVVALIVFLLC